MNRIRLALGLLAIMLLLLSAGCASQKANDDIEAVLQLNNDILEDPLLRELDELEESLFVQDELPESDTVSADSVDEQAPPAPKSAESAAEVVPPPGSLEINGDRRVLFGIIRKASESGITLQVIQAKALTPEELKKIKIGEKIPITLLTKELLPLHYSSTADFEKLENGIPVPSELSDVGLGQRVRVALNTNGNIKLLRIIRN